MPNQAFVVPSFPDLTIKKRNSAGTTSSSVTTEVLYLKGARERREFLHERPGSTRSVHITQCDQRRSVLLNPEAKLYAVFGFQERSEQVNRRRLEPEALGADVTTTFDAVDTGERRPVGRYLARRVRTTVIVEPSPAAKSPASTREIDGWYVDLPGLGCADSQGAAFLTGQTIGPDGVRDRHHYNFKGVARRGYVIEETNRFTQRNETKVSRVELIEVSDDRLDSSLFEIPRDYRPALPLVRGGYDLTKPDTVANRVQVYWDELTLLGRSIFRW